MLQIATCHTLDNLWTFLTTVYQQREKINIGKKQKDLRLCWPLILLSVNTFILLNRNSYLFAKC